MTIKELIELSSFPTYKLIFKNSISTAIDTDLEDWLLARNLKKIIVVGDCTDLCTYQLAMYIKLLGIAKGLPWEVILPENAVETYDLPVETAEKIGAVPHPGDLLHIIFLYHMALNGINIVKKIV